MVIGQLIDSKIQLPEISSNMFFFGIAIVITGVLRVSTIRITSFVPALIANDLSHKIITKLLYRNYDEHIRTNTSVLINKATQQLNTTIDCIGLTMVMIIIRFWLRAYLLQYFFYLGSYISNLFYFNYFVFFNL